MTTDRTALLIIRIEFDEDASLPPLIRVRDASDVSSGFEGEPTVIDADMLVESVAVWLMHAGERVGA